jgi:hypothetical protein
MSDNEKPGLDAAERPDLMKAFADGYMVGFNAGTGATVDSDWFDHEEMNYKWSFLKPAATDATEAGKGRP